MTKLKRLLSAVGWPFAKPERKPPRIVMECQRIPDKKRVRVRMVVENTETGQEYELKMLALCLFAVSRGFREESAEEDNSTGDLARTARNAYELGSLILWEARGRS